MSKTEKPSNTSSNSVPIYLPRYKCQRSKSGDSEVIFCIRREPSEESPIYLESEPSDATSRPDSGDPPATDKKT